MSLSLTRSCIAKCTLHKNLRVLLCLLHPFHRNPPPSLSFFIWHREFLGLYPTLGASLVVVARRRVSLPEVLPATSAITRTCCACCFPHAGGLARCTTKCATLTTTRTRTRSPRKRLPRSHCSTTSDCPQSSCRRMWDQALPGLDA